MDKSRRKEIKKQYKAQSRKIRKNLKWNNKPLTQGKQLTVGLPQWDCPSGTDGWLIRELKHQGKQVDDMKLERTLP